MAETFDVVVVGFGFAGAIAAKQRLASTNKAWKSSTTWC